MRLEKVMLLLVVAMAAVLFAAQRYPPDGLPAFTGGAVTSPLGVPTGCTTPGYAFSGDTNTGMGSPTADELCFAWNGQQTARWYNTGGFYEWEFYDAYDDASNLRGVRIQSSTGSVNIIPLATGTYASTALNVTVSPGSTGTFRVEGSGAANIQTSLTVSNGPIVNANLALAGLGTPANGSTIYCTDCLKGSTPCSGSSTGALAKRENGAWNCD